MTYRLRRLNDRDRRWINNGQRKMGNINKTRRYLQMNGIIIITFRLRWTTEILLPIIILVVNRSQSHRLFGHQGGLPGTVSLPLGGDWIPSVRMLAKIAWSGIFFLVFESDVIDCLWLDIWEVSCLWHNGGAEVLNRRTIDRNACSCLVCHNPIIEFRMSKWALELIGELRIYYLEKVWFLGFVERNSIDF